MMKKTDGNNMSDEEVAHWPVTASRATIRSTDADTEGAGAVGNLYDSPDASFDPFPKHRKASKRPKAGTDF